MAESKKPKSNQTIAHAVKDGVHTFTVTGLPPLTFDERTASDANNARARSHGWKQRISDAAAIPKTRSVVVNGVEKEVAIPEPERLQMKWDGMHGLIEHYASGAEAWETPREATGPRIVPLDVVLEAICRAFGKTPEQRDANLAKMVRERGGDLEANAREFLNVAKVLVAVATIEAERRAARMKGDTRSDDALAEMMSGDGDE